MVRLSESKESSNDDLLHTDPAHPDSEVRCTYPSKICRYRRAVKPNGKLHKLCEFHRIKANANQRQLQERRRVKNRIAESEVKTSSSRSSLLSSAYTDDEKVNNQNVNCSVEIRPAAEDLSISQ